MWLFVISDSRVALVCPPSFEFSAAGPFCFGPLGIIEIALRWLVVSFWPVFSDIEAARSFSIRSNFKFSSLFCCISSDMNLAYCVESFAGVAKGVSVGLFCGAGVCMVRYLVGSSVA